MATNITAVQDDPNKPSPDEWRPKPASDSSRAKAEFLANWDKPANDASDKDAEDPDDDNDDADLEDERDEADVEDDEGEGEDGDQVSAAPAKGKAKPAADDTEDEDEEEDDEDKPDDDSDLDEDDEEQEAKPTSDDAKLRKKEQQMQTRMRQQFDRERDAAQAELAKAHESLKEKESAAAEATSKFERLRERAALDPWSVLEDLGVTIDEDIAKDAYIRAKGATDPKFKEAAAQRKKERDQQTRLSVVEKELADRKKAEADEKKNAELRQNQMAMLDGIAKTATKVTKATLTNQLVKADPSHARALFAQVHLELWRRDGVEPQPRAVVLAAEKSQRDHLRRLGINPKTVSKAAGISPEAAATKNGKNGSKPVNGKGKAKSGARPDDGELKRPTKQELLEEDWSR